MSSEAGAGRGWVPFSGGGSFDQYQYGDPILSLSGDPVPYTSWRHTTTSNRALLRIKVKRCFTRRVQACVSIKNGEK